MPDKELKKSSKRLPRAYSPTEVMSMSIPRLPFSGKWEAALGKPAKTGTWLIWGNPGNGKSSFVMQLAKYLCNFGKVVYDSLEEGTSLSFQMSLDRHRMGEVNKRFSIMNRVELEILSEKLEKRRSPEFVIIDSFQYTGLTYKGYKAFKEKHPDKLLIFVSHAKGADPKGDAAKSVEFDADVKILVKGFKALCKSRFMEKAGENYTVWAEGAARCWPGDEIKSKEDE